MSAKYFCDNCTKEGKTHSIFTLAGPFVSGIKFDGFDSPLLDFCESCWLEFQRKHRQYDPPKPVEPPVFIPTKKKKGIFG